MPRSKMNQIIKKLEDAQVLTHELMCDPEHGAPYAHVSMAISKAVSELRETTALFIAVERIVKAGG